MISCPDNVINSISIENQWYTTGADAYLINSNCPFDNDAAQSVAALKNMSSFTGWAHISLEAFLSVSGFSLSEGMATELISPLKQDRYYYVDMAYMYYDGYINDDYVDQFCDPLPERTISIVTASDSIFTESENIQVLEGFITTAVSYNGNEVSTIVRPEGDRNNFDQWKPYWDCFRADGGESHIAIIGETKALDSPINCTDPDVPGMVYNTGYAIDAIRLVEIPDRFDSTLLVCEGVSVDIDLRQIANGPYNDKATYEWDNGSTNPERQLTAPGLYEANMILPCVTVPFSITVEEVRCTADIFVANIFSPNNDGINDILLPSINAQLPVSSYSFQVYNRWGSLVYSSSDINNGWDGRFNGRPSAQSVYLWSIEYTLENSDDAIRETGEVFKL